MRERPPGAADHMRNGDRTCAGEAGFTLTEILVVILVVGILAAIAIPSFLGQRGRGVDADAKSNLAEIARAMTVFHDDNDDSYACGTSAQCLGSLRAFEASLPTQGVVFGAAGGGPANPTRSGYRITVTGGDGRTFWLEHTDSGSDHGCNVNGAPNNGGCNDPGPDGAGSW